MGAPHEGAVKSKANLAAAAAAAEQEGKEQQQRQEEDGEELRMPLPQEKEKIADAVRMSPEKESLAVTAAHLGSPLKMTSTDSSRKTPNMNYWQGVLGRCKKWDKAGVALVVSSTIFLTIFALPWTFPWITDFGQEAFYSGMNQFSPDIPCDYTKGTWVFDDTRPLYTSCYNLEKHNCTRDGRTDTRYQKWRWQPENCLMDRFDAARFLAAMRRVQRRRSRRGVASNSDYYATLAFIGDSLGQNMFLSMRCILEARFGVPTRSYSKPRTATVEWKPQRLRVVLIKSPYLVSLQVKGTDKEITGDFTRESTTDADPWWELHVDKIPAGWGRRLPDFDVIVFNSGHWWVSSKVANRKIEFAEGKVLGENITVVGAFRHAMTTVMNHMVELVQNGTFHGEFYLRSYSPHHFTKGEWNTGGRCDANLPILTEEQLQLHRNNSMRQMAVYNEAFESVFNETKTKCPKCRFHYLRITELSDYRPDAHPSNFTGKPGGGEDCSHWCVPGLPDTWNELLLLTLEKPWLY